MIKNKIKSLLSLKGINQTELGNAFGVSKQSINRKITTGAFNISDLIKLGEITNTTVAIIDNETDRIVLEFDKKDIKNGDK